MATWITPEFWHKIALDALQWLVTVCPALLVIFIFAFVLLKLSRLLLRKLKPLIALRMRSGNEIDSSEIDKRVETLVGIVNSALRVALWSVITMLTLKKLGVDIAPIIAGAGIIGLAVGFGAQELVRDFISGFFMLMENQIRTGDVAVVNGTGGLVESVGLRTIVLRDMAGVVHVFQNGKVNTLSNMTKGWSAMVFDIGVAYKEDPDKVITIMKQVAESMQSESEFSDSILEPMEVFGVDSFGDSAVVVKGRLKTKPIQQWAVGREYRKRLKLAFDKAGVEIPFPHRTIYWGENMMPHTVQRKEGD